MTKAPTPSYQPTTTFPTLSPTTTSEFRWQAGIYYNGGPINANTTYSASKMWISVNLLYEA